MTHYFKIDDNNSSNIYRIAIESALSYTQVLAYLYQYSNYVVYLKSTNRPHKKEKGIRVIPGVGTIVAYSHFTDRANTFSTKLCKEVDLRHAV